MKKRMSVVLLMIFMCIPLWGCSVKPGASSNGSPSTETSDNSSTRQAQETSASTTTGKTQTTETTVMDTEIVRSSRIDTIISNNPDNLNNPDKIIYLANNGLYEMSLPSGEPVKLLDRTANASMHLLDFNGGYAIITDKEIRYYNKTHQLTSSVKPQHDLAYDYYGDITISPDGKILAYRKENSLCISDIDLKNEKVILKEKLSENSDGARAYRYPRFSADGKGIWCSHVGWEFLINIYYVGLDGGILLDTHSNDSEFYEYISSSGTTQYVAKIRMQEGDMGDRKHFYTLETFSPPAAVLVPKGEIANSGEILFFTARSFHEKTNCLYFYTPDALYKTDMRSFRTTALLKAKDNEHFQTAEVVDDYFCVAVYDSSSNTASVQTIRL